MLYSTLQQNLLEQLPMTDRKPPFVSVEEALDEIRAGRMIVLVDDEDRENEGDLTMAAEKVTPEAINFMAKFGRGLICLAHDRAALRRAGSGLDHAAQYFHVRHAFLRAD